MNLAIVVLGALCMAMEGAESVEMHSPAELSIIAQQETLQQKKEAGIVTVVDAARKELTMDVDKGTRIVFTAESTDVIKSIADLSVGLKISVTYKPNASPSGRLACLVVTGATIDAYLANGVLTEADRVWCPAIATSITATQLTASLIERKASEVPGLRFWDENWRSCEDVQSGMDGLHRGRLGEQSATVACCSARPRHRGDYQRLYRGCCGHSHRSPLRHRISS